MILAVLIACEIGFWVVIVLGLLARYLLEARTLGLILLSLAPVIDLVLLITTAVHLRSGAEAEWVHGLAAVYIGFSVAYGHQLIRWADIRFAHRFADGPAPMRLVGADHTRARWTDVARTLLAAAISALVLSGLTWLVGNAAQTAALEGVNRILLVICGLEFIWAVGYTIWPRPPAQRSTGAA
ncbi:hypothetical protein E3T55_05065 [Cryobacterium frigoriphilum]|uniref:Uncharacterized protein n=1 Tax=Cryobacterium frigoriphilum TaxID=1259150 RepID=A0A4R9A866_9MICO|nr:hypothetical protein [Cryobacterium frigoriphilum]TFD54052.1 hypothetical protein E3T55_05065 [Cryobacterium frigoriphilum]